MRRLRQWRTMLSRTHNNLANDALAEFMERWLATSCMTEALASVLIAKGLITGTELEQAMERQARFMDWVFETRFEGFRAGERGVQVTNQALAHQTLVRLAEAQVLGAGQKQDVAV